MLFAFIIAVTLVAILTDYYIWRRVIVRHNFGKVWKWGYLAYAVVVDLMILAALLIYGNALDSSNFTMVHAAIWIIAVFFMNTFPKVVFSVVSLPDYLVALFTKKRSHIFGYAGTVLGLFVLGAMIWGAGPGRTRIEVRKAEIASDRLPASFDGFRVVQFSDVHISTMIRPQKMLRNLVETINALEPDIVVATGDLVNAHAGELRPDILHILSETESRRGIYVAVGNHDLGFYIFDTLRISPAESYKMVLERLHEIGWKPLVNQSAIIRNGDEAISLTGISYPSDDRFRHWHSRPDLEGSDLQKACAELPDTLFNIMLSHTPVVWDDILATGYGDLTLSGHVHSMQIKLRVGKWVWSPAKLLFPRWSGLYEENGRYLYVNDGVGHVMFPMRIGTRPEVTLITLHSINL